MRPAGSFVTMITPFAPDGSVDFGAVRALVDWYEENGCDGIFAVCQSSEIHLLSEAERVAITREVLRERDALVARGRRRLEVVASGHVSDDRDAQAHELSAIAAEGPDGLILITNRFDIANTSEDAWIRECDGMLARLPESIPLGAYECPRPYKRLLTEKTLGYCAATGRFGLIKDTCCDAAEITRRVAQTAGSTVRLYNANAQTLLPTLRAGAAGYCGIMANFHPKLYAYLCHHFEDRPAECEALADFLSVAAFTEQLAYPVTAKYHLRTFEGIAVTTVTRTRPASDLRPYDEMCVGQMKRLADEWEARLGI